MKRLLREKNTIEMLDAFQDKLDELNSCDQIEASYEHDDDVDPHFNYLDQKDVRDSDRFWTKYTLYLEVPSGRYVTVFGDPDIYKPEDGYFDAEFDNYDEAYEWFLSYHGFEDDDDEVLDI